MHVMCSKKTRFIKKLQPVLPEQSNCQADSPLTRLPDLLGTPSRQPNTTSSLSFLSFFLRCSPEQPICIFLHRYVFQAHLAGGNYTLHPGILHLMCQPDTRHMSALPDDIKCMSQMIIQSLASSGHSTHACGPESGVSYTCACTAMPNT